MKIILAESVLKLPIYWENSEINRYFREKKLIKSIQSFPFFTFHLSN